MADESQIRALFITNEYPPGPGGLGEHAFQLSMGLHRLGYELVLCANQSYADENEIKIFNQSLPFKVERVERDGQKSSQFIKRFFQIRKLLRRHDFDLVISSGAVASLTSKLAMMFCATKKQVIFIHASEFKIRFPDWVSRWLFKKAENVCVSEYTRKHNLDTLPDSTQVINNGADVDLYDPEKIKQIPDHILSLKNHPILLTVGRMCARKGQDRIIKLLPKIREQVPDIQYLLVGHEQDKEKFKELALNLNVSDQVSFVGKVKKEEIPFYYSIARAHVLPSRHTSSGEFEGFGISIAEAALMRTPSIGAKGSGIEDAIIDGETGILVDGENEEETVDAIVKLLTNTELRDRYAARAQAYAQEHFTWEKAASQLNRLIRTRLK